MSGGDCHAQNLTLLTVSQKCLPCNSAISSSSGEGWREPSADAKVPAPHGEPVYMRSIMNMSRISTRTGERDTHRHAPR